VAWHLAQLDVGRAVGPAAVRCGQRHRHKTDDEHDLFIGHLSVWTSLEALRAFVYAGDHRDFLRRRAEWFEPPAAPIVVRWWVRAGTIPTVREALDRLERLRRDGPTPEGFSFRSTFPPSSLDRDGTPAH
jgi:hypothetical protein